MSETDVALRYPGGELPLLVMPASEGAEGIDTSKLLATTGKVALDISFVNTAACTSAITYIDGDAGILRYRGYPIDQLAERSSFLEVSYLLIYGELPSAAELEAFDQRIRRHTLLHEDLKQFFNGCPRDAHPMPVLSSAVSALKIINGGSYTKGPRSSPVLARKPTSSPGRYCIRFSRVFTNAVSSAMVCLVRLASDRFRCAHTGSTGFSSWA